jgi:signal transduction histidine kinase
MKGTGIGLALVKRSVEVHGGKIWVESAGIGKGATFRFTLAKIQPHPVQP